MSDELQGISPLEALSIHRFGGRTTIRERLVTVGTARIELLSNNPNRLFWRMQNESDTDVRIGNDPNITATSGWLLLNNGGGISMTWEEDGEAVGYQVFGISSAAAKVVRVAEVVRI